MRKAPLFLPVIAAIMAVFACSLNLSMPEKIQIKGSPAVRFAANMNLSDMFSDMIEDGLTSGSDGDMLILPCTQPNTKTFIIYISLFKDDEIELDTPLQELPDFEDLPEGVEFDPGDYMDTPEDLILAQDDVSVINFAEVKELLQGFEFKEVTGKLYISGTEVVNSLRFNLSDGTPTGFNKDITGFNEACLFTEKWAEELTKPPSGGREIDLTDLINNAINSENGELNFFYEISVNDSFHPSLADNAKMKAELVLWLPLDFIAGDDGADIKFPENFFGDGDKDLFGRESSGGSDSLTDIFESLRIKIDMNTSPFAGGTLTVKSGSESSEILITAPLNSNSLDFGIDDANMTKINSADYFPFVPKFKVHFGKGGELKIPVSFMTTAVYFEAKMKYTYDLAGD